MTGRDWIAIRGKLYELDDFLAKWGDRVRAMVRRCSLTPGCPQVDPEWTPSGPQTNPSTSG